MTVVSVAVAVGVGHLVGGVVGEGAAGALAVCGAVGDDCAFGVVGEVTNGGTCAVGDCG